MLDWSTKPLVPSFRSCEVTQILEFCLRVEWAAVDGLEFTGDLTSGLKAAVEGSVGTFPLVLSSDGLTALGTIDLAIFLRGEKAEVCWPY